MKRADNNSDQKRNLDELIYKLSELHVLDAHEMIHIKGGETDGEGNGGATVIIIPTRPPQ